MIYALCRQLFALLVAYPVTYFWLGLTVRHPGRFPQNGPAIIIANHNSHLDTLALITRFPLKILPRVRIAAAADYFFTTPILSFISQWFLGLTPMARTPQARRDALKEMADCLGDGGLVVLFPEGTRGQPEKMENLKTGLWHLLKRCPKATLNPVYFHGLGRSLPKGAVIPVPFFIDACVGEPIDFNPDKTLFMEQVKAVFQNLRAQTLASLEQERQAHEIEEELS